MATEDIEIVRINAVGSGGDKRSTYGVDANPELARLKKLSPLADLMDYHLRRKDINLQPADYALLVLASTAALGVILLYAPLTENYLEIEHIKSVLAEIAFQLGSNVSNIGVAALAILETFNSFRPSLPKGLENKILGNHRPSLLFKGTKLITATALALTSSLQAAAATEGALWKKGIVLVVQFLIIFYAVNTVVFNAIASLASKFEGIRGRTHKRLLASFHHFIYSTRTEILLTNSIPLQLTASQPSESLGDGLIFLANEGRNHGVKLYRPPSTATRLGQVTVGLFATAWVFVGLLAYLDALYRFFEKYDGHKDKLHYSMTVLLSLAYLGLAAKFVYKTIMSVVDFFWPPFDPSHKKPLAFHIYLLRPWITMIIVGIVAAFSFGSTVGLIKTSPSFQEDGTFGAYRDWYVWIGLLFAIIFNNAPNQLLLFMWHAKWASLFGTTLEKDKARFGLGIDAFLSDVDRMAPEVYAESMLSMWPRNETQARRLVASSEMTDVKQDLERVRDTENDENLSTYDWGRKKLTSAYSSVFGSSQAEKEKFVQLKDREKVEGYTDTEEERLRITDLAPDSQPDVSRWKKLPSIPCPDLSCCLKWFRRDSQSADDEYTYTPPASNTALTG